MFKNTTISFQLSLINKLNLLMFLFLFNKLMVVVCTFSAVPVRLTHKQTGGPIGAHSSFFYSLRPSSKLIRPWSLFFFLSFSVPACRFNSRNKSERIVRIRKILKLTERCIWRTFAWLKAKTSDHTIKSLSLMSRMLPPWSSTVCAGLVLISQNLVRRSRLTSIVYFIRGSVKHGV